MSEPIQSSGAPATKTWKDSLTEATKKIGEGIDKGISRVMEEVGTNVRTTCPHCQKIVSAAPNQTVECPECRMAFHSTSAAQRTGEMLDELKGEVQTEYEKMKPSRGQ